MLEIGKQVLVFFFKYKMSIRYVFFNKEQLRGDLKKRTKVENMNLKDIKTRFMSEKRISSKWCILQQKGLN